MKAQRIVELEEKFNAGGSKGIITDEELKELHEGLNFIALYFSKKREKTIFVGVNQLRISVLRCIESRKYLGHRSNHSTETM